jgi:hypothetical protein
VTCFNLDRPPLIGPGEPDEAERWLNHQCLTEMLILRISEARDLGESDRFAFYDNMKAIIAAPPGVLRIHEKHVRE